MTTTREEIAQQRIPSSLQSVFLRSNRGENVHKAPPNSMAQKTYLRNWSFQRNKQNIAVVTGTMCSRMVYDKKNDKVLIKGILKKQKEESKSSTSTAFHMKVKEENGLDAPELVQGATIMTVIQALPLAASATEYTLQEYFDALIKELGYSIDSYSTLATAYYNKATPLQLASYGPRMVQIVRESNVYALRETLAVGLSPNPCNQYGESLLHMICRRGDTALLRVMMEAGSSIQVSDDFGRTPLHDACWAPKPAFGVVELLLKRDAGLFFLKDKRGHRPLSYVTKDHWPAWMEWLGQNADRYFPESGQLFQLADLVLEDPDTFGMSDPKSTLGLEIIQKVANGGMTPREARLMAEAAARAEQEEEDATVADTYIDDETSLYSDESDYSDSDDDESDYDSEEEDRKFTETDMMNQDDMAEMFRMAQAARQMAGFAGRP